MCELNNHVSKIQKVESPRCDYGYYCEGSEYFLLHCLMFVLQRQIRMNRISALLNIHCLNIHHKLRTDILLRNRTLHGSPGRAVARGAFQFIKTSRIFA